MRIEWASKNVLFTCKLIMVNIKTVSGNLRFITLFSGNFKKNAVLFYLPTFYLHVKNELK